MHARIRYTDGTRIHNHTYDRDVTAILIFLLLLDKNSTPTLATFSCFLPDLLM